MQKLPFFLTLLFSLTFLQTQSQSLPSSETQELDAFDQLKNHFHQYVEDGTLAGYSILVSKNQKVYQDHFGDQNKEAKIPIQENTLFRLASMTKPITSVAIMMLVEQGKLNLEDPAEKFIPSFQKLKVYDANGDYKEVEQPLTIRQLLSHTGGISSSFDPSPVGEICQKVLRKKKVKSLKDLVDALAEIPLSAQPGSTWIYSYSTDILAYVVEQVSGQEIDDFMQKNIFDPLKMKDTGFKVSGDKINRFTAVYASSEEGLKLAEDPKNSPYVNGTYFPRGNGGLVSTVSDYFRFASMLLNEGKLDGHRILKKETIAMMNKNMLPKELSPININGMKLKGQGFGLGFGVLLEDAPHGLPGDYFWPGAYFTYFFIRPQSKGIGIFMTQLNDMSKMPLLWEFHQLAGAVLDPPKGEASQEGISEK